MKVSGKDIIAKWQNANGVIQRINRLGEIGNIVRNAGYDVLYDGFSVCNFIVRGTWMLFSAYNYDTSSQWTLGKGVQLAKGTFRIDAISPEAEYEVEERPTEMEKLARGDYNGYNFEVSDTGSHISTFVTFEQADEYAKKVCQSRIDSRWKDRDTTRYYWTIVENNEQRANERGNLRHYPWYSYNGHEYYINVSAVRRDD